jgi:hypothetical protein
MVVDQALEPWETIVLSLLHSWSKILEKDSSLLLKGLIHTITYINLMIMFFSPLHSSTLFVLAQTILLLSLFHFLH